MEDDSTEYIDGDADDFTIFLFSEKPKEQNTIKLELSDNVENLQIGLHIFQELLMIFTSGIKYLFGNGDETVNITILTEEDINLMNQYFKSMGFKITIEIFTIGEYLNNMKLPNYFINKELIEKETILRDFYYETSLSGKIYRITFDFIR
jgi:hypothetical protein